MSQDQFDLTTVMKRPRRHGVDRHFDRMCDMDDADDELLMGVGVGVVREAMEDDELHELR